MHRIGRVAGMMAILAMALLLVAPMTVGARSFSFMGSDKFKPGHHGFNFDSFKNFFDHFRHHKPPVCGPGGYGYECKNTTTVPTTTVLACTGTPVVSLSPNPATTKQNVSISVSGLSNCNGTTVDIDTYKGCTSKGVLTSFVSGPAGGNVVITPAPLSGGYGQKQSGGSYGYWICVNNKGSQATEAILNVTGSSHGHGK